MKAVFKKKIGSFLKRHLLADQVLLVWSRMIKAVRWVTRSDGRVIRNYLSRHPITKLQIGSGPHVQPGWLNSDLIPCSKQVVYLDATRPFPFEDEVFNYIYSEHMIEHIPLAAGMQMLKECYRVLRKGGKLRVVTPDLAFLLSLYLSPEKSPTQAEYLRYMVELLGLEQISDETVCFNNFMRAWGHHFIYDKKTLRRALEQAGFASVERVEINCSPDEALRNLENEGRLPPGFLKLESMLLEATKV